jgi:hypothetical protein
MSNVHIKEICIAYIGIKHMLLRKGENVDYKLYLAYGMLIS